MKDLNQKPPRGDRGARFYGRGQLWRVANAKQIITDQAAATRIGMRNARFSNLANSHGLSEWQDDTGATYRSIDEVDQLAKKLDLPIQLELSLEVPE